MNPPLNTASNPAPRRASQARHGVVGAYLQPLLQYAAQCGISASQLAQAAQLGCVLDPVPQWLPATDYLRLLDAGAQLSQDPFFGLHVGQQVKLGAYNVYGLILLSCQNFGQVLQQTLRYEGLAHDLGKSELMPLQAGEALAEYRWHSHFPHASRHLVESVFAGIAVFGSWMAGGALPIAAVGLQHDAPADVSEYEKILGARPQFSAPVNYGRFDARLLAMPVPNADVSMYPVLQQHAEQLLQEKLRSQQDGGIIALVRNAIMQNLAQDQVRLAGIAAELQLSPRTLQRKLSEAHASFQQVLDETRHQLACQYLRQAELNLADIAFMLGFQEQSSFNHAFKEWQGMNPGAWREQFLRNQ
ncbi:AraC family transcriptional regulator [Massilia sp. W12]|uniref:AraC family transcriptional regulator n=1 Tax=Massilia sp. W12 TaxID=3126507 RepID=UPI0030CBD7D5